MAHTILIIDEKPSQGEQLAHSLQHRLGYKTLSVASETEAVARYDSDLVFRPDLILLDFPSEQTHRNTEAVKTLSLRAPLVALVRFGDHETVTAVLDAGAQDFLVKPVAIERISTTFHNLLTLRDMRREVERLHRSPVTQPAAAVEAPFSLVTEDGNIRPMEDIEAEVIRFALQYYRGRMTEVARRLHIGRSTLYRKLSSLGIQVHNEAA